MTRPRVTFWRLFIVASLALGAYSIFVRFHEGIGGATNLSDGTPWGLWVGLDILTGVALAAGGFMITAVVYVFGLERYRPIVRPALLTAFLGYLFFVIGLLVELGRPWNIWHAIIYWNPNSALFEVAWCVMLYTIVLALEVSNLIFERFGWVRLSRVFHAVVLFLVIAGVMLSTLHQSSLGTLFVIAPGKMHALWYSPALPLIFYVSCMCAGLAMVMVEAFLSQRFLKHPVRVDLMARLARVLMIGLMLLTLLRFSDLWLRSALPLAFQPTEEALAFWVEVALFQVIPIVVLWPERRRASPRRLFVGAFSAVAGLVTHRMNVATTSFVSSSPTDYFPTWMEFSVSIALVVAGVVVFWGFAKWTPLFAEGEHPPHAAHRAEHVTRARPGPPTAISGCGRARRGARRLPAPRRWPGGRSTAPGTRC
ncbi:MAG: Ni/Fe-hydrogenase cytochrome b subunit [Deltaproteobacteria bacterium]|nr:Ni/Fe-hydrogenase cytochrome b subunit [Deltaproteobacteria bacterium]